MAAQPSPSTHAQACAILELAPDASPEAVRRGYRRLAMLWHPDRFEAGSPLFEEAQQKITLINAAYRYLQEHPRPAVSASRQAAAPPRAAAGQASLGRWGMGLLACAGTLAALAFFALGRARPGPDPGLQAAPGPILQPGAPGRVEAPPPVPAPALVVDQAALVIFWPSRKELEEAPAARAEEVARFLESAQKVRELVQKARPELEVRLTDAEVIQVQGVAVMRSRNCGYGYLVYAPSSQDSPGRQLVLEGMQAPDKVVNCVTDTFPTQEKTAHPN